jgi:hypothetical protein
VGAPGGGGLVSSWCDVELGVGVDLLTSDVDDRAFVVDVSVVLVFVRSCVVLTTVVLELPPFENTFLHSKPMSCSLKT